MPEVSVSERDYRAVAAIIRDPQRRDQVASTFIELCKRSDTNSAKYEAAANKLMLAWDLVQMLFMKKGQIFGLP